MKIIVSPAKKMNMNTDMLPVRKPPRFQKEAEGNVCQDGAGRDGTFYGRKSNKEQRKA